MYRNIKYYKPLVSDPGHASFQKYLRDNVRNVPRNVREI